MTNRPTHEAAATHRPVSEAPVPLLSIVLGYGPALVLPVLGLAAWLLHDHLATWAVGAGQLWGAAILVFLSGVRRGLSFFTAGGPRTAQIATMIWLFLLGLGAFLLMPRLAFVLLIVGYASIALLDPPAARRGEAPAHFARLRPPQMAVALAGLLLLLVRAWM